MSLFLIPDPICIAVLHCPCTKPQCAQAPQRARFQTASTASGGNLRRVDHMGHRAPPVNLFFIRLCGPLVSSLLISIPFPKITNTSKKLKISIKRGELDVGFNESWIMLSLMCQVYGCNVCDVLLLCVRSLGMWALGRELTSLARLLPQPSQTSL